MGLEAASWRYFGRPANELSWGESATLAVLPNAPSLIYPGKNQIKLLKKRDFLLKKLYTKNYIDKTQYDLSLEEPLPQTPFFEKIGKLFDYYGDEPVVISQVKSKAERMPKELFYIPAFLLLAFVFFMQRRRRDGAEA